jgi:hypothetical protein
MVVLHGPERPVDHPVLEIEGPFHDRDLACERMPQPKMFRAPRDALAQPDQSRCHSGSRYCRLTVMNIAEEMHFYASSQIEAALEPCIY